MDKHPFLTGMGLGMAAGAAAGAVVMKNEKAIRQGAKNTVKHIGKLAEDAADAVAEKLPR